MLFLTEEELKLQTVPTNNSIIASQRLRKKAIMLENFSLLSNLTKTQLTAVEKICELKDYQSGDFLIREGENTSDIYFLSSGNVDLFKRDPETQNDIKFKEMSSGQSFGEMSFIDGLPSSCSVKASSDTRVYVLSKQSLLDKVPDAKDIISVLSASINYQVNEYLRDLNDCYVDTLQHKINILEEKKSLLISFLSSLYSLFQ